MVPLNPFIVPRVIKIFVRFQVKNPNVFCLIGDVSRSSVLACHDFAEQNYRNNKKPTLVEFFFVYIIWEFTVIGIDCSAPPLATK